MRAGDKATAGQHYLARCHLDRQLEPKRLDGSATALRGRSELRKSWRASRQHGQSLLVGAIGRTIGRTNCSAHLTVASSNWAARHESHRLQGEARAMRGTGRTFVALMKMCPHRSRPAPPRFAFCENRLCQDGIENCSKRCAVGATTRTSKTANQPPSALSSSSSSSLTRAVGITHPGQTLRPGASFQEHRR